MAPEDGAIRPGPEVLGSGSGIPEKTGTWAWTIAERRGRGNGLGVNLWCERGEGLRGAKHRRFSCCQEGASGETMPSTCASCGQVMEPPRSTIRFGSYELCPKTREFRKHGKKVRLRPQPLNVLKILLENAGEVVTREELQRRLWPSDTFVDFEHGLNTAVKELRGVLGDSATEPQYIETLPRVGYRMLVPAEMIAWGEAVEGAPANRGAEPLGEKPSEKEQAPSGKDERAERVTGRALPWRLAPAGVLVIVLIAGYAGYRRWAESRAPVATGEARIMLAVLPFENLTGDRGQDYFSDGLTEEMAAQLGGLDAKQLGVIGGTSMKRYKQTNGTMRQIGSELGAQYVLDGSVRRDAERVRVTAKLVQTRDQTQVWSKEYDRQLTSLLALQSEIAHEIAREIQLTLDRPLQSGGNAELTEKEYQAYDLYLRGRYFWNKRTVEGFRRASEYFQQAAEKDPRYARAYAGLADCYTLMGSYGVIQTREMMPKARAAAQKALELDGRLAEAHTSVALVAEIFDWDWKTADKEFRRAIELNPNYATAHQWYAEDLALQGQTGAAMQEIDEARRLDPLSLIILADRGAILYFSRQYDAAIEQFRAVLEMEPSFGRAQMIAFAHAEQGKYAEALAEVNKWKQFEDGPWIDLLQAYLNGKAGNTGAAKIAMGRLLEYRRHGKVWSNQMAIAELGLGNKENAVAWLQRAYADHSITTAIGVDPMFDPLRGDKRFVQIENGMGLGR